MNSSSLCSLLLFTLCLAHISHFADAKNALIGQLCHEAGRDKRNCMNIFRSDPRIRRSSDYRQLSQVILELALAKATAGQKFLKEIALTNKSPAIAQCANFDYDGVVGSFRSALGEIKSDPQTASYDAKVAGDGPETCDRGLAARHIVNPAISGLNREILLLSKIAFLATCKL